MWNLEFQFKIGIEEQGQSPCKTIGFLIKVFCIFCLNLVLLDWMDDELLHEQALGWHIDTHPDTLTQTQAMTIPETKTGLG